VKRLFLQYIYDMYCKIETCRLNWIKHNQHKIRAELYNGIQDAIDTGTETSNEIGKSTIFTIFTGSPRHMNQLYQDIMSILREKSKPNLFITFT
jgi:hypothetical protein